MVENNRVFMLPSDADKRSLRVAHLAGQLFLTLKKGPQNLRSLRGQRGYEWLDRFTPEEHKEAIKRLEDYRPLLVDRVQTEYYKLTDDVGKEMTLGQLISDLTKPQYVKSKESVQAYWKRNNVGRAFLYLMALCVILFLYVQSISLPPTGGPITFEPLPAKLTMAGFSVFLVAAIVMGYLRDRLWIPNEQDVAVNFYEAHSFYERFIKNEKDRTSLNKSLKLVRKAVAMLELAKGRAYWATLAPSREKIWSIGQEVNKLLLPAMRDHKRSSDMGDHLATLARCFLESSSESMEIALGSLGQIVPTKGPVSVSLAVRVSVSVRAHPNAFAWIVAPLSTAILAVLVYSYVGRFTLDIPTLSYLVGIMLGLHYVISKSVKRKER
jgi:hypothetical protein